MKDIIRKLIDELNNASELYYNGKESFMSDSEFDEKLNYLKRLEDNYGLIYSDSPTINVGSSIVSDIPKVAIYGKPMLSLDKVHSAEEIHNFFTGEMMASIKCDGLSIRLIYEDGELTTAYTRGNGVEGGQVTSHVHKFLNVPIKINKKDKYIIDGEAIIYDKDFEKINKNGQFKNSRNTASGALSLLDMSIVEQRRLSFIAWEVVQGGTSRWHHSNLSEAQKLGFTTVPMWIVTPKDLNKIDKINKIIILYAKNNGIPCDGVVWKINDIIQGEEKGKTAHHFLNAVAWKPAKKEYDTKLIDIEMSLGRTGQITPVAIFKPINIDGSECSRASLHNLSVMTATLGPTPYVGQEIKVYKANEIIPQISWSNKEVSGKIINKSKCPVCGEDFIIKNEDGVITAWCDNPNCEGKLSNKIDHYFSIKGLNVKGISKKTIEKLIDWGWVSSIKDIYKLHSYQTQWINQSGFGKASVIKILDAIDDSKNNVDLSSFISAIGIPLVGKTIAKEIVRYYSTWEDFRKAVGGDWTEFEGFGPEISNAINKFDYSEFDEIAGWLTFKQPDVQVSKEQTTLPLKEKVFTVTGKLKNYTRNSIKEEIESLGGKVASAISSKTNYLITNTPDSGTQKNKDAQRLGVTIITENEYIELKSKQS